MLNNITCLYIWKYLLAVKSLIYHLFKYITCITFGVNYLVCLIWGSEVGFLGILSCRGLFLMDFFLMLFIFGVELRGSVFLVFWWFFGCLGASRFFVYLLFWWSRVVFCKLGVGSIFMPWVQIFNRVCLWWGTLSGCSWILSRPTECSLVGLVHLNRELASVRDVFFRSCFCFSILYNVYKVNKRLEAAKLPRNKN